MSLGEFWNNFNSGVHAMRPVTVTGALTAQEAREFALMYDRCVPWLTPEVVAGFDPADFDFLEESKRSMLIEAVQTFRQVAEGVPLNGPATAEQIRDGVSAFEKVYEILRPDKYMDMESFIIGTKVEQRLHERLPTWVHEMQFECRDDANGQPGVWVWIVIEDSVVEDADFRSKKVPEVSEQVKRVLNSVAPARWPYLRIRTVSESNQLARAGEPSR